MRLHISFLFRCIGILLLGVFIGCTSKTSIAINNLEKINYSCDIKTSFCSVKKRLNKNIETKMIDDNLKMELIYYYDALCGWCYGFSPVIEKVQQEYRGTIKITVISGGLFTNNKAGYVNEVAPHIKAGAYKSVESLTGVKFGEPFLKDVFGEGKMILNSLYPTIALCIVREKYPEKELEFAAMLLKAVYFDGINPIEIEKFGIYASKIGFDIDEFNSKLKIEKYKIAAEEEFKKFKSSRYSGMPSVVLKSGKKEIPISKGYINYNELKARIDQLLVLNVEN